MSLRSMNKASKYVPEHKPGAYLNQSSPVQNTWYTVLDTTRNVRIIHIGYRVNTTGETLEMRLTLDGNVFSNTINATAGSWYYVALDSLSTTSLHINIASEMMPNRTFLAEARSAKLEIRKTTASGTGSIQVYAQYAQF